MEAAVRSYFAKGLAESTRRTYKCGSDRYLTFCQQSETPHLPLREAVLCSFVTHLALQGLKHRSIKVYLSATRHMQIAEGLPDPFQSAMPRLEYVLKGVKRSQAEEGSSSRARLPITPAILRGLKRVWDGRSHDWDTRMVWAACCLSFFALRRKLYAVPKSRRDDDTLRYCL